MKFQKVELSLVLHYSPYTLPLLLTAFVSLIIVAYVWQRRQAAGTIPYILLMLGVVEWCVAYTLELSSPDLVQQTFWAKFEYFGILAVPVAWFIFACQYTHHDAWVAGRRLLLLAIEPILFLALLWTNEQHGLVWSNITLTTSGTFAYMEVTHGAVFWAHAVYSYVLFLAGCYFLFQSLLREKTIYRAQIAALLIAGLAPWIGNIVTLVGASPILDLTPFAFAITGLTTAWALFRFQLLDVSPMARDIVFESMSDALIAVDKQGRIVDLNPAASKVLGRATSDIIGRTFDQILPQQSALIAQYRNTPEAHTEITIGQSPSQQFLDLRISPIRDRQGDLAGRVIILHDITERKKTEEALQAANRILEERTKQLEVASAVAEDASRLKSQFLSTVSHELRSPFNAILGFTDLLLTERLGALNPTQRNFLERIAGNNKRLLSLINDVLDLSRIEAGRMEIVNEPYNPREMLEVVTSQTSSLFSAKSLTFESDLAASLPETVIGDHDRVQQIVINLLSNAAKFTKQGKVTLKAFAANDNNSWQIEVIDTGTGIAPHLHELIFEPFRQVDGTSTRQFAGSGLGLSIVRELCRLMKGSVHVESEPGHGSTFIVTLPLQMPTRELVPVSSDTVAR